MQSVMLAVGLVFGFVTVAASAMVPAHCWDRIEFQGFLEQVLRAPRVDRHWVGPPAMEREPFQREVQEFYDLLGERQTLLIRGRTLLYPVVFRIVLEAGRAAATDEMLGYISQTGLGDESPEVQLLAVELATRLGLEGETSPPSEAALAEIGALLRMPAHEAMERIRLMDFDAPATQRTALYRIFETLSSSHLVVVRNREVRMEPRWFAYQVAVLAYAPRESLGQLIHEHLRNADPFYEIDNRVALRLYVRTERQRLARQRVPQRLATQAGLVP